MLLALGAALGMAGALPLTAWAVRMHRWPGLGSSGPAAAIARTPPEAPVTAPHVLAAEITPACSPSPPSPAGASANTPAPTDTATNGKLRKKRRSRAKPAVIHDVDAIGATTAAAPRIEESVAAVKEGGGAQPRRPVEDQAATELSTSLR